MAKKKRPYRKVDSSLFEDEANLFGVYIIASGGTIRSVAKHYKVSKSTVHMRLTKILPKCNKELYNQVHKHLKENKKVGTMRGGLKTKELYKGLKRKQIHNLSNRRNKS